MSELKHKVKRVLFFDSGVGGLSVYKEVARHNPDIETYFVFDNECFPYGEKDESFLIERIDNVISRAVERFDLSAIVVACNTASTIALPVLRKNNSLPIVGVVPAVKPAAMLSQKGIIGLLATPGTVKRQYTKQLIDDFARNCEVIAVGDKTLATIAEKRMISGDVDKEGIRKALMPFLSLPEQKQPDVIVLGCTHYPLLQDVMKEIMPDVRFIDSGEAIGRRVRSLLDARDVKVFDTDVIENKAFYTGILKEPEQRKLLFSRFGFNVLERLL